MYAALIVSGCGRSSNPTTPTPGSGSGSGTADNPITVFITNSVYSPNPLTVKAGQFVNFKNNDANAHSATFDNGMYESGDIPPFSAHDIPVAGYMARRGASSSRHSCNRCCRTRARVRDSVAG
jgi:plastocyanin